MSDSFVRGGLVGLDGCQDRLNRDPAGCDQLPTGSPCRRTERCRPNVLPHDDSSGAAVLHRRSEVLDILSGKDLGDFSLERHQLGKLVEIVDLERFDHPVVVLVEDQQIE